MVRITVLKSLRTTAGAEDWLRLMSRQFPTAKVVDNAVLKNFSDVAYTVDPTGFSSHVVIEEDLTPVIEAISGGEFGEMLKALMDAGYAEIDNYGVCFTEKWHETLNKFMGEVFERGLDSFKSSQEIKPFDELDNLIIAFDGVLKAMGQPGLISDGISDVTEATEGEPAPVPETLTDEQVKDATLTEKPPKVDLSDPRVEKEDLSDEEVKEQMTPPAEVFKSLAEAKSWENPDPNRFYVDTMSFHEKREHGPRYLYIVREKEQRDPVGAMGNRLVRR